MERPLTIGRGLWPHTVCGLKGPLRFYFEVFLPVRGLKRLIGEASDQGSFASASFTNKVNSARIQRLLSSPASCLQKLCTPLCADPLPRMAGRCCLTACLRIFFHTHTISHGLELQALRSRGLGVHFGVGIVSQMKLKTWG